jgi:plasmid stabilization system protein ParE
MNPGRKPAAESSQPPAVVVKPLEIQPAALAEAEEAAAWYAERDPRVAARFAEELEAALNRIVEAPHRWPAHIQARVAFA